MKYLKPFNESRDKTSTVTKEDLHELKEYFSDIIEKWNMAPSRWISDPTSAPSNFHFSDYPFYYHFYKDFNDKLSLLHTEGKSKNVVNFSIQTCGHSIPKKWNTKEEYTELINKTRSELVSDVEIFLKRILSLGWHSHKTSRTNDFFSQENYSPNYEMYLYLI